MWNWPATISFTNQEGIVQPPNAKLLVWPKILTFAVVSCAELCLVPPRPASMPKQTVTGTASGVNSGIQLVTSATLVVTSALLVVTSY